MTSESLGFENFGPSLVEDYHPSLLAENPLNYPGDRPADSFVTDGHEVNRLKVRAQADGLELSVETGDSSISIDDYLSQHQAAPMSERIPVIGYGANLCPASLKTKLGKTGREDSLVVPTVYVPLHGYDVVWSGGPGMNGNFIAALYKGSETTETNVTVGVSFVTTEQLLTLHATELAYDFYGVDVNVQGSQLRAYYYGGKDSYHVEAGRPLAVETVPAQNRSLPVATTRTMTDKLMHDEVVVSTLRQKYGDRLPDGELTADDYVNLIRGLKKPAGTNLSPRLDLKRLVANLLQQEGRVLVKDSGDPANLVSWANPSTLPKFGQAESADKVYRLPEQEMPKEGWSDLDKRRAVLHGLTEHFHRHYPTKQEPPRES